jgi:heme oxygenase
MKPVRFAIKEATQKIHCTLHTEGAVSKLVSPGISETEYHLALTALWKFYSWAEACRETHDLWDELSLRPIVVCLEQDLSPQTIRLPVLNQPSLQQLQGILFVAHGAGFGRSAFAKNITSSLPHVSRRFVTYPMNMSAWRFVTELIEKQRSRADEVINGASIAFAKIHQFSEHQIDT